MKDFFDFAGEHWLLTFFLACIAASCIASVAESIAKIFRRG